jgi:7,8-dihydropterin-6-yl-methyl-4-(beta-D-ribofuranosyl)aminobenzene 5'-phosphate synthase
MLGEISRPSRFGHRQGGKSPVLSNPKQLQVQPDISVSTVSEVSPGAPCWPTIIPMLTRLLLAFLILSAPANAQNRVTILYDAFGKDATMKPDWGYSAFIEYNGKRILFDTGNDPEVLEHNAKAAKVDLSRLDFVVISHRHTDHTMGIAYLIKVNPSVKIFVPERGANIFGGPLRQEFLRRDASLPEEMQYYGGKEPERFADSSAWPQAHFELITKNTELIPGVWIVSTVSENPGTIEMRENTLALKTDHGLILFDGCSHAGVENILKAATEIDPHISWLFGGLHMVVAPLPTVQLLAKSLHEQWKLDRIAPGHCTGEPEFAALRREFGDHYVYAGLGQVIPIP